MSSLPSLLVALLEGFGLGAAYYAGLWCTVTRGLSSRHPAMLFLFSLLLRAAMAVAGFWYFSQGDWRRLASCLAGFFISRFCALRIAKVAPLRRDPLRNGGGT
jgi:F1F0 ATPase subunit 2